MQVHLPSRVSLIKTLQRFLVCVKCGAFLVFSLVGEWPAGAEELSLFARGEELFMQNKLQEAVPLLEGAIGENPSTPQVYLYLGAAYQALGLHEKAIDVFKQGIDRTDGYDAIFFFNMGNSYLALGHQDTAELMYTEAISLKSTFPKPYLNRANTRVRLGKYQDAIDDYTIYLRLDPTTPQRTNIEKMIALLGEKLLEAQRRQEEEEQRRKEEEARRKQLLDSVLKSLEEAAEETQDVEAGTEGAQEFSEELELAD
ncbi:tetratricopeptide repeat protein [Spirochaeta thermophila]|uniref:tetratricopeptide repeat protein n=1 Tax=Winmispira thermophila TaxID=154 RepID=UPI0002D9A896|nr:tetratricopeptide repeat protein [Spirochaeta thermophila]